MATPPPVSDAAYPTEVGAEARSNYVGGRLGFVAGYVDNLYAGSNGGGAPSEEIYSVFPTISYDQTTPRQHRMFTYSPGFTIYRPSSNLNEFDQSAIMKFKYLLTPHLSIGANDAFLKSSNAFGLSNSVDSGAVSGSQQALSASAVAPFANRLSNTVTAQLSFQFSPVGMIGASGTFMKLHYPNSAETPGLYDSDMRGGSAFYNRRIAANQYAGVNYQFSRILAYPANALSKTQTNTIYAFYSIYPKPNLSLSLSGGPQHYEVAQTSSPTSSAWGPMVMASMGWQGLRTNVAANYSREVTGGGGLLGAFVATNANLSTRWQIVRSWMVGANASYSINKSVTTFQLFAQPDGHTMSGFATVEHSLGTALSLTFEYDRVHQSYGGIAAISDNPNSNRETISLAWQFTRALGR
jgi:hypothetical protein